VIHSITASSSGTSSSSSTAAAAASSGHELAGVSRHRVTALTEMQVRLLNGCEERYKQTFGCSGYGNMVASVIRAVKCWVKFGVKPVLAARAALAVGGAVDEAVLLQDLLAGADRAAQGVETAAGGVHMQAAARCGAYVDAASAADVVLPPAYIWEIFVLFVLERQLAAGGLYDPAKPLQLLIDVMAEASQLLRTGSVEPIVVPLYYSEAEAKCCEGLWGGVGLCTPFIINPVDPTYNCTAHHAFCYWDIVAEEAGELHRRLVAACQLSKQQCNISDSTAEHGCSWKQLVQGSSLGRACGAFSMSLLGHRSGSLYAEHPSLFNT
jgi:hypothetical protein